MTRQLDVPAFATAQAETLVMGMKSRKDGVTVPDSPAAFAVVASKGRFTRPEHVDLLNEALCYLEQRKAPYWFIRDHLKMSVPLPEGLGDDDEVEFTWLMVMMPPRHGKSEMCSRYFPAWYLSRNRDHHVILTSYEATFARSWGRKARDVLEENSQFGTYIRRDTKAANDWEIEGHEGGMMTAGIGGPITGRGANLMIVDDPVKNAKEATSEVIQKRNWDWWDSTAATRLEPDQEGRDPITLVIQTRWNEADLAGQMLANEEAQEDGQRIFVLELPAIAEENDAMGREPGEPLWPARWPLWRLERRKNRLSSYYWNALYQQHPSPEEGAIFQRSWWNFYDEMPKHGYVPGYTAIDTGHTEKTTNDPSVMLGGMRIGQDLYLTDLKRGWWTAPELMQRAEDTLLDEHQLPLLIEDTPGAKPIIQMLRQKLPEVLAFPIEGRDKIARAMAIAFLVEGGRVFLPRKARWVQDFIEELATFPNGRHDDRVDAFTMLCIRLFLQRGVQSQEHTMVAAPPNGR